MAYSAGANDGTLNGTNEVTLIAAPGAGVVRTSTLVWIYNCDTATVNLSFEYANDTARRVLDTPSVASGGSYVLPYPLNFDTEDKSLIVKMDGAAATTNPDFYAGYVDA